jgi:tRNA(fMet)-specific endonuclease VapC
MTYLLDTNTCIDFLNRRNSRIEARLTTVAVSEVSLCSVVKAELYLGAYRSSQREKNLALLADFFPRL